NLVDGIFYAKILFNDSHKQTEIDARTSDAIALAVRFKAPVYTYEFILASAGIVIEGNDFVFLENIEPSGTDTPETLVPQDVKSSFASMSDEQLQDTLSKALADELYEKAARIRDEITRRKSS
ncbi:MAG TPA: bifunctional nuclease domain-containing protein, partial [Parapedobacter sp.]|nr:bifunctional nuclease domain-containing protein [Parapedobacter sp.]